MKIVTAAETREIDRLTSERFGVPALTLMENAGTAVAEVVLAEYPSARRLGIICGKGNNGGDGFVAARKLHEAGREVQVLLLADPSELRGDAAEMFKRLPVSPIFAKSGDDLKSERARAVFEADVLVDAILGTGFRPEAVAIVVVLLVAELLQAVGADVMIGHDQTVGGDERA